VKDLAEKRIKTHQTPNSCSLSCSEYWQLINFIINKQQGGNPSGKVGEFDIGQGKVREIRNSLGKLWFACGVPVTIPIVTK